MNKSKNVLVTGGLGSIGLKICEFFIKKNHNLIIVDNLSNKNFFVPKEKTNSMKNNIYNLYLKSPLTKKELQTLWGITKKLTK